MRYHHPCHDRVILYILFFVFVFLLFVFVCLFFVFWGFFSLSETENIGKCGNLWKIINSCFFRSSHQRCSTKRVFWKISQKFIGKHLCQNFLFNKEAKTCDVIKKRGSSTSFFRWTFLRTLFFPYNTFFYTFGRLFLPSRN